MYVLSKASKCIQKTYSTSCEHCAINPSNEIKKWSMITNFSTTSRLIFFLANFLFFCDPRMYQQMCNKLGIRKIVPLRLEYRILIVGNAWNNKCMCVCVDNESHIWVWICTNFHLCCRLLLPSNYTWKTRFSLMLLSHTNSLSSRRITWFMTPREVLNCVR
jgi:hypothetical protein